MRIIYLLLFITVVLVHYYSCTPVNDPNIKIDQLEKKIVSDSAEYIQIIESLKDSINKINQGKDSFDRSIYDEPSEYFGYRYDIIPAIGKLFSQHLWLSGIDTIPDFKIIEEFTGETQCYYLFHSRGKFNSSEPLVDFYTKVEKLCKESDLCLPPLDEYCGDLMDIDSPDGWYSDSGNPSKFVYFVHLTNIYIVMQIKFIKGSMVFDCYTHDLH